MTEMHGTFECQILMPSASAFVEQDCSCQWITGVKGHIPESGEAAVLIPLTAPWMMLLRRMATYTARLHIRRAE